MSNNHHGIRGLGPDSERMLNIGPGSFVRVSRIIGIFDGASLPMKRWREKALEQHRLVDATKGKKMKSLILTDSNHVILSSILPQTLQERLSQAPLWKSPAQIEREDGLFVS